MYGPTKGDMQFLLVLAGIGLVSIVIAVVAAGIWLGTHVHIAFQ